MCKICKNVDLTNVQLLTIDGCHKLTTVPSIVSLKYLNIRNCDNLVEINCRNLTELKIYGCEKIVNIPCITSLKLLYICSLHNLKNVAHMPALENIELIDCKLLKTIPNMFTLKEFHMKFIDIGTFGFSIPNLLNLTRLELINCTANYIPHFKKLSTLIITKCNITKLPLLNSLVDLQLRECRNIKSLPKFKYLQTLTIDSLPLLTTIPFYKLKLFGLYNCENIQYLPSMYTELRGIERFSGLVRYSGELAKYKKVSKLYSANYNVIKLYNNLASLWKQYKLRKYTNYLQINIYSNPSLPYMKYYIENSIYNEVDNQPEQTHVGIINSKNKLIWLTFKSN
jgi:hypothetical protein